MGQSFKLDLVATDPEGTQVSFSLGKQSPKGSSVMGDAFHWDVEGKKRAKASVVGEDECGESKTFKFKMTIYQCRCKNGGQCLSDVEGDPECSVSRRCKCPEGFTGDLCEEAVNWCVILRI